MARGRARFEVSRARRPCRTTPDVCEDDAVPPTIRRALPDELDAVGRLTVDAYVSGGGVIDPASPYLSFLSDAVARLRRAGLGRGRRQGCGRHRDLRGTGVGPGRGLRAGEAEIRTLAVDPAASGEGIGEALDPQGNRPGPGARVRRRHPLVLDDDARGPPALRATRVRAASRPRLVAGARHPAHHLRPDRWRPSVRWPAAAPRTSCRRAGSTLDTGRRGPPTAATMARPSPVEPPLRGCGRRRPRAKRSKTWGSRSAGMPGPSSATERRTSGPSGRMQVTTRVPGGRVGAGVGEQVGQDLVQPAGHVPGHRRGPRAGPAPSGGRARRRGRR